MAYLMANKILTAKQFGFLRGRSTKLQLLKVVDKLTKILDNGCVIDTIYCDFMKAFDTVPHQRLIEVLMHYGLEGPILAWIKDFISSRKQQVHVNGCKSKYFDVISGVPQGSVLGPSLFIIFINTLVDKSGKSELFLYADDLKIYKEISSEEDAEALQQDLDRLYDWTKYSFLRFHPDKCVVMRYMMSSRNTSIKSFYNMDETRLKIVTSEKDLGILFKDDLSFDEHIAAKVRKATSLVGLIRRSFTHLDINMFRTLFTAIIRPHLEYGAPIMESIFQKTDNYDRKCSEESIKNDSRFVTSLIPT